METDFGIARLVLEDGTEISRWKEYTVNSNFLSPTDAWSFTFGTETEWKRLKDKIRPDRKFELYVDEALQATGWIDSRKAKRSITGGVTVNVQGRDVLAPLCKANIHPDTATKGKTVEQIIEEAFRQVYPGALMPTIVYDNDANRAVVMDESKRYKKTKKGKSKNVLEYYSARPQEGAFEFCVRLLRKNGLWMWGAADGSVVVSSPNYDQPASYLISCKRGDTVVQTSDAEDSWDRQNVPSHVIVRGKSASKEWQKSKVFGRVYDTDSLRICPSYIQHDEATTADECKQFAMQELSRLKQEEKVYSVTCKGHRDPFTGAVYAVDTIAKIDDEILDVHDDLWCLERSFTKGADSGTHTQLRFIPKGAIKFSDIDAPE